MAKKQYNLGADMDSFKEDLEATNKKQQGRVEPETKTANDKSKGSAWRKTERPIQKTIFFDEVLNKKINIVKELEGKNVQDIIYDIVYEWFEEHYEEKKKAYIEKLGL